MQSASNLLVGHLAADLLDPATFQRSDEFLHCASHVLHEDFVVTHLPQPLLALGALQQMFHLTRLAPCTGKQVQRLIGQAPIEKHDHSSPKSSPNCDQSGRSRWIISCLMA